MIKYTACPNAERRKVKYFKNTRATSVPSTKFTCLLEGSFLGCKALICAAQMSRSFVRALKPPALKEASITVAFYILQSGVEYRMFVCFSLTPRVYRGKAKCLHLITALICSIISLKHENSKYQKHVQSFF